MKSLFRSITPMLAALAAAGHVGATTLVGVDDITNYTVNTTANSSGGVRFIHYPFTASANGTATTLFLYCTTAIGDATTVKLGIYDNDGNQLGITGPVALSGSPGWVSGSISGVSIVSGTTYKLGFIASSGSVGYRRPGTPLDAYRDSSGTYASPPATITSTLDPGIDNFAMYADGTASGGGSAPARAIHLRKLMSRWSQVEPANDDVLLLRVSR